MKDSFILYTEQREIIDKLSNEQAGKLIKAIYEYVETDEMPKLDELLDIVIIPFKQTLDRNKEKYQQISEIRSKAGVKGAKQKKQMLAKESKCYDNDNDNVYDNDNVNDSCVDDLQKVIEFFENNIAPATPYLLEVLQDYSDTFTADMVILAMQKAIEAKAPNIKYIKAILNSWEKKGIKTPLEAEQENVEHKNRVTPKEEKKAFQNYDQRSADGIDFESLYAN